MRPTQLVAILVLLALTLPASPAQAGGVVGVCDETHLLSALSGGGTVTFTCSGTITLTSTITIAANTTIDGSGQAVTLSGGGARRLFKVNSGVTLTLDRLTVANAGNSAVYLGSGAAAVIRNSTFSGNAAPSGGGGAIYVFGGSLTVSSSTLSGNTARLGGAIYGEGATLSVTNSSFTGNGDSSTDGGAILSSDSALTVSNSSFEGNTGSDGGAIGVTGGTVTMTNSTFYNNSANFGGAFNLFPGSVVVMGNCTISQNRASYTGGGIRSDSSSVSLTNSTIANNDGSTGGGIYNSGGTVELKNTIVANSSSGGNCAGTITNGGSNISYPDATCPGVHADPRLRSLALNGGPTKTMSPSPGSAAIDAGDDAACTAAPVSNLDQRGIGRAGQGAHCDIGAYEVAYYRATKTTDESGACTSTDCALREAIMARNAAPGHDGLIVPKGTYLLTLGTPAPGQDTPGTGDLDITDDLTIVGDSPGFTIIHQNQMDRVFEIAYDTLVTMRNLTIEHGTVLDSSGNDAGGGIFNHGGLILASCAVQANSAADHGGGIASGESSPSGYSEGSLTVSDSTFFGNNAPLGDGGGIYSVGTLTISNSTFSSNTAGHFGGGIENVGWADITNVTFSGNGAGVAGGNFDTGPANASAVKLTNTIAANSTAGGNCAGAFTNGGGNLSYPDASCGGVNRDPLLGALASNGGSTQTMALGAGSAAIDAGNTGGCQNAQINNRDQRGYARFVDGNGDKVAACDIGAFEYGASGPPAAILDTEPPEVSIELVPAEPDGANGWYRSPVTVNPDVTDASPVIDLRCALDPVVPPAAFDDLPEKICPFLGGAEVSADGEHTVYAAAVDTWGNKSTPVSREFRIAALTSLEMTVNREQAYTGSILEYKLKVRNLTPSAQAFAVTDPIPANTEIVRRINYNPTTNSVEWSGVVEPWGFKTFTVYVRIKSGTPGGTAIVNTATLEDEPGGGSASATTIVKMLPPYRGHRADVDVNEVVIRGK